MFLILKFVPNFMKIYKTLVSALMCGCTCCTHRHFPLPGKIVYETLQFIYSIPSNAVHVHTLQYSSWKHAHIRPLSVLCYTTSLGPCSHYIIHVSCCLLHMADIVSHSQTLPRGGAPWDYYRARCHLPNFLSMQACNFSHLTSWAEMSAIEPSSLSSEWG